MNSVVSDHNNTGRTFRPNTRMQPTPRAGLRPRLIV